MNALTDCCSNDCLQYEDKADSTLAYLLAIFPLLTEEQQGTPLLEGDLMIGQLVGPDRDLHCGKTDHRVTHQFLK